MVYLSIREIDECVDAMHPSQTQRSFIIDSTVRSKRSMKESADLAVSL